ncbi:MAG TPA: glycoside hydrolase family 2 TIM barrel-domain containing protein, partial [Cyclobacteriaceae bacterium]|nr:glycoside hydrolase family 2 TIM barrel-domain containing protein [Cyclobacteriaceae bacterium]
GYNAVRCSHNPPSPALLDACDRLGMLVIDETFDMWSRPKNPYDYSLFFNEWWQRDVSAMVLRDRNHPSVILWSIGNEIPAMEDQETVSMAKKISNHIRQLDPGRPITAAVNGLSERKDPFFNTVDVAGYNYAAGGDHGQKDIYELDHKRVPERIMFGSETYPLDAFDSWKMTEDHSWVVGDFVWTAFDYIGEASIGWRGYWMDQSFYPWTLAYCGDMDLCGWKRPQSFYRDTFWKGNQLSLFVKPLNPSFEMNPNRMSWSRWHFDDVVSSWNWEGHENEIFEVNVYSSCQAVELFLNGKTLGRKPIGRSTKNKGVWTVPYSSGELRAVGFSGSKKVAEASLRSAGKVTRLRMTADRSIISADAQDLSYVTVELVDENGIRNANAEDPVEFSLEGPGSIAGIGNGNPISVESYQQPRRKAWLGRCLVIVRSGKVPGEIRLTATANGLQKAAISIQTR